MFVTKHILYDLSEASKITGPGLGSRRSRGAKVSLLSSGSTFHGIIHFPQAGHFPCRGERGGKIHPAGSDDE